MATPAPALLQLRAQINDRWPLRSKASDGIMGDASHRLRRSAHNDGNALDVTADPRNGPNLQVMVDDFCRQMRANPNGRLQLMIFNRRIYSVRDGWRGRTYLGVNPHRSHAHIEVRRSHRGIARHWSVRG